MVGTRVPRRERRKIDDGGTPRKKPTGMPVERPSIGNVEGRKTRSRRMRGPIRGRWRRITKVRVMKREAEEDEKGVEEKLDEEPSGFLR